MHAGDPKSTLTLSEMKSKWGIAKIKNRLVTCTKRAYGQPSERLNPTSRKHLRTKLTPDFHLTNSKNGSNLGSESK